MSAQEWVHEGIDKGYCSTISCETHDPDYLTEQEVADRANGDERCIFVVRILDA